MQVLDDILLVENAGEVRLGDGALGVNFSGIRMYKSGNGELYRFETYFEDKLQLFIDERGRLRSADGSILIGANGSENEISAKVTPLPGSNISGSLITMGSVVASKLSDSSKFASTTCVFSASDYRTVNWTSGTLRLADGRVFNINSGSTGAMSGLTFVYFDSFVSTSAFQLTTNLEAVAKDTVILVCDAKPAVTTDLFAFFVAINNNMMLNVNQLSVNYLSALSGDMGDLIVGRIKLGGAGSYTAYGATPPTGPSTGTGVFIDYTGLYGLVSNTQMFKLDAVTGAISISKGTFATNTSGQRIEIGTNRITIFDTVDSTGGYVESTGAGLSIGGFGIGLQPATMYLNPAPAANLTGIITNRYVASVGTGTSPFGVTSTTRVDNLNVQYLNGNEASAFAAASHAHSTSDITSGFPLPLSKGGTGGTTLEEVNSSNGLNLINTYAPLIHDHYATAIVNGTFDNARISQSNVTQHQAALSIATSQLTGTIGTSQIANNAVTAAKQSGASGSWEFMDGSIGTWSNGSLQSVV